MSFSLRGGLDNLVTIQKALTITSPVSLQIKNAYKTIPNPKSTPETPCFFNIPRLIKIGHFAGARTQTWQVKSQLLVEDVDLDRATDIVMAFVEAYINALSDAITLNGLPVILTDITTDELTGLDYGGKRYPGIDITTSYTVPLEAVTVGP